MLTYLQRIEILMKKRQNVIVLLIMVLLKLVCVYNVREKGIRMKKSLTLRTQISLLMALLVVLQSLALVVLLVLSGIFNTSGETTKSMRFYILLGIILVTIICLLCVLLFAFISMRKIPSIAKHLSSLPQLTQARLGPTGLKEIDELSSAVEKLNKNAIASSQTMAKVLKMTLLPIGYFEVTDESENVMLTEFIYKILHRELDSVVSKSDWDTIYEQLTSLPAEGYSNIYRYVDKNTYDNRWLRIMKTDTDTGCVGVMLDVTKDIEEHRRLVHELDYDTLTHLYNRTAFKREANMKLSAAPSKIGAMIFTDIDNLKYINDTFGHDMGDRLIIKAGEMFREFAAYGGVVSRISGDEFAIYIHGFDDKKAAIDFILAQFKRNENYSLKTTDGHWHRIRSSSGVAWYPEDSDNITNLLKLADFAMYEAKHTQKGRLLEFNGESYKQNSYLLENREAINRLLDEGLIRFAFQPILDLRTGTIYAYEALMRPLLDNFKSPMEIISVAEAQSKLGQLERLVMFVALQTVVENLERLGNARIFINSIPSQVLNDDDMTLLRRSFGSVVDNVVIEITEEENNSPQKLKYKVDRVRELGVKLAIDDFGSGYSNELRILSISPDIVKIDMGMIQGICDDNDKQRLVKNIVSFCHSKNISVVAEGVEDLGDLEEIIRLDLDFVQGYYTGKPQFEFARISRDMTEQIIMLNKDRAADIS